MKHLRFLKRALLLAAVAVGLFSCEESLKDLTPAELVKGTLIDTLKTRSDLSEFVALMEDLDLSTLDATQLTVFAVKNATASQVVVKAAADRGSAVTIVVERHIVEGSYPKSVLREGQQLTALDGTVLTVSVRSGGIYVNGVALGDEIAISGSVVHVVDRAIPAPDSANNEGGDGGEASSDRMITYDGREYPILKTEFSVEQWFTDDGSTSAWMHTMKFYTNPGQFLELSLVTNSQAFTGGAFTFGDVQINNMNKAVGNIHIAGADGRIIQDGLAEGSSLRVVRASDNTLTVEFSNVPTRNYNKQVSLKFVGEYKDTEYGTGEFVPVRNIAFPGGHALSTLKAKLNTLYQLSDATIEPASATNRQVVWKVENALINGSSLIFDKAGTATVTAYISEGTLSADGTKAAYTQTWTIAVGDDPTAQPDPEKMITYNGKDYPIRSTEYTVNQRVDGSYGHRIKFFFDGPLCADIELATNSKDLAMGAYASTGGGMAAVGQVLIFLNFTTATGVDYGAVGGYVRVVRNDDGTIRVQFADVIAQASNLPIELLYVGKL